MPRTTFNLPIETPTGADIVDNAFVEDEEGMLEIPLVTGGW